MSIKVCHLTSVHSIDDVRIFGKECTSIAANGFEVILIAFGDNAFEDIKNGVRRISIYLPVKNRLQRIIKRSKILYKSTLMVNADIYHFHDPELLLIALKLKRKGKKVIFDSHEFYGEQIREKQYLPPILGNVISYLYMKYEEYVCKKIDAVIQICTLEGKDYFNGRAAKSVFITNAPILREFIQGNIVSLEKRKCIAHIGILTYERGITHLIQAVGKAKGKLILCGKFTPEGYQKELMELPEYSVVDYRGFLNSNEINEVLNECYIGISTLLNLGQYHKIDTLPTKVYEYMSMGLPVIISDTPYAKRLNEKYKFGICVDPSDIDEIADAIVYLFNNISLSEKMGANGREVVLNEFNWQIEEKKLLELYTSI